MVGGKKRIIKRPYKNKAQLGEFYQVAIVVGGQRCTSEATISTAKKKRCLAHIGMDYEEASE